MVMSSYMEHGGSGAAWNEMSMIPAPPGTSLGQMAAQGLLAEVTQALGLAPLGVYTPWATRAGDTEWDEIVNPDTNIAVFGITDALIRQAQDVTFGQPLPFVAIVTKGPMTQAAVDAMWDGSAYKAYETQAVYRQDDAKDPPTIVFMHWGERIDMAQLPKSPLGLEPKAAAANGALIFAAQVPVQTTTTRATPPSMPFTSALSSQLAAAMPVQALTPPAPTPVPVAPAAAPKMNLSLPIAIGAGAAVLSFVLWRRRR
jgi:hypothetical protein